MSLFERLKNKRKDLLEAKFDPSELLKAIKRQSDLDAAKADAWLFGDYDAYESFNINTKKVSSEDESV